MIDVRKYVKPKENGGSGNRTIIYNNGNSGNFSGIDGNFVQISANKGYIDDLWVKNGATIDNAQITYLVTAEGNISKVQGVDLMYENGVIHTLKTDSMSSESIDANIAKLNELNAGKITSSEITTDYLTVTKSAHFFELIIDKIRSVGGTQIMTAANCTLDFVEAYNSNNEKVNVDASNVAYYRVYWRNSDEDGRNIDNQWVVNDQAICQSFNVHEGTENNASNKYYWRLVTNTDNGTPKYVNLAKGDVADTMPENATITVKTLKFVNALNNEYPINKFNIRGQILNTWNAEQNKWTVVSKLYGLQITYDIDKFQLSNGILHFETEELTKLNFAIIFDDDTMAYEAAPSQYTTSYSINIPENKTVKAIVVTSEVIDTYFACNWIDLSNVLRTEVINGVTVASADSGCDISLSGHNAIPSKNDNIVQLGYRYQNTENPTIQDKSRASAIIIAAYNTPDKDIVPPSYAQYQLIRTFNLEKYRGTFFDATRARFVGTFVTESGTVIDDGDLLVKSYKIVTNVSTIMKDENNVVNPKTIRVKYIITEGENTTFDGVIPENFYTKLYSYRGNEVVDTIVKNAGTETYTSSPFTISDNIDRVIIEFHELVAGSDKIRDAVQYNVQLLDISGVAGEDGGHYEFRYKNSTTQPDKPADGSNGLSDGWADNALTPDFTKGEYTWMTQCFVNSANEFGIWSTPFRLTGEDGNGYEYIFKAYTSLQTWGNNNNNPAYWSANQTDEYLGPTGYEWSDNAVEISSTYKYLYVSIRKSANGTWGKFSTPTLWAKYGEDGKDGADGTDGIDGTNGQTYKLVPTNEICDVTVDVDSSATFDQVVSKLHTYLYYRLMHIDGDTTSFESFITKGYYVRVTTDYPSGFSFDLTRSDSSAYYSNANLLNECNPSSSYASENYRNYNWLVKNAQTRCPSKLVVSLYDRRPNDTNKKLLDQRVIYVTYLPKAFQSITNSAIIQAVQGSETYTDSAISYNNSYGPLVTLVENNQSSIIQLDSKITSEVSARKSADSSLQTSISKVEQKADSISSTVTSNYNYFNGRLNNDNSTVKIIDLTGTSFNENYFYPVRIDLNAIVTTSLQNKVLFTFQVDRPLDPTPGGYGTPTWGNVRDGVARGVDLNCTWQAYRSAWGEYDPDYLYVNDYRLRWTAITRDEDDYTTKVIGNLQQWAPSSTIVFYVRGGSKYNVRCDHYGLDDSIAVGVDGFTVGVDNVNKTYPVITNADEITIPTVDKMLKSEILQTAEEVKITVYDDLKQTGIDVTSGNIVLNADLTTIKGDLTLRDTNQGLIIKDDYGNDVVTVQKSSIGSFGTQQASINNYTWSSGLCTYVRVIGKNEFRSYLSTYDTTAAYLAENSVNTTPLPVVININKRVKNEKIRLKNIKIAIRGDKTGSVDYGYSGTLSDYKIRYQIAALNRDNVRYDSGWVTPGWDNRNKVFILPDMTADNEYTVTSADNGYEFYVYFDIKGPNLPKSNPGNAYFRFTPEFTIDATVARNTKIGTDGIYSISKDGEFWASSDKIGMYWKTNGNPANTWPVQGVQVSQYGLQEARGKQLTELLGYSVGNIKRIGHVYSSGYNVWPNKAGNYSWGKYNSKYYTHVEGISTYGNKVDFHPDVLVVHGVGSTNTDNFIVLDNWYADGEQYICPEGRTLKIYNYSGSDRVWVCCRTYVNKVLNSQSTAYNYLINYNSNDKVGALKIEAGEVLELMKIDKDYWKAMNNKNNTAWPQSNG